MADNVSLGPPPRGTSGQSRYTLIKRFVEFARWCLEDINFRLGVAMRKSADFEPIKAGYINWKEHARYVPNCMENHKYIRIFANGLQRVSRTALGKVYLPGS